jgi:hypothetical protein
MPNAPVVRLNGKDYVLARNARGNSGQPIIRMSVREFGDPLKTTGGQTQSDLDRTQAIYHALVDGLGMKIVPVAWDKYPLVPRRFFDSTADTRWSSGTYPGILDEESTEGDLEVIRASVGFKDNLWGIWEDDASLNVRSRKYVGSSTSWAAGGDVAQDLAVDATSSGSDVNVSTLTVSHTCSGTDRLLVVAVSGRDGTRHTPTGVTYAGTAMILSGTTVQGGLNSSSLWYLLNPNTGANNIVATWAAGNTTEVALGGISFTGADQNTAPISGGTGATGTSSVLATVGVSNTANGDFVVDCVTFQSATGISIGSGQTQRWNINVSGGQWFAGSTEPGNAGTVTMSWTSDYSGDNWAIRALIVQARICVGLDLVAHKDRMVALVAEADDHMVYHSTDGATWTLPTTAITAGLLDNNVTANEDIDAGLLATVGNELVAVVWHESNGTITFFSSTNAGVAWSDEAGDIASGNGPQGVAAYTDIDSVLKLYVGTREGLWLVDTTPSTWTIDLIFPMRPHNDNCRRMTVHNGALWFSQGVSNNEPAIIYRMMVSGDTRIFDTGELPDGVVISPSSGDGLPTDLLGSLHWMTSAGMLLYASIGGGALNRNARVICHNGQGWHSMYRDATANKKIQWIDVSPEDNDIPRLHFAFRTSSSASNTKFLAYPNTNPASVSALIKRQASSYVDLPFVDNGMPTYDATWLQSRVAAGDLSATDSDQYINLYYGVNDVAYGTDSFTELGDILSGTKFLDWASGAGVTGFNSSHRVILKRDASVTTDAAIFKSLDVIFSKSIPARDAWEFTIDIPATKLRFGLGEDKIIANIEAARNLLTLPIFTYGRSGNKYVKVMPITWYETLRSARGGRSTGAPSQFSDRAKFVEMRLEEQV